MKNYISADEFTRLWIDFINQQILSESGWQNWYDHEYKKWTKETIGLPVSEEKCSPFGDFIKSKTGLRYRKEDGLVDLTFAPDKNFEGLRMNDERPGLYSFLFLQNLFALYDNRLPDPNSSKNRLTSLKMWL